MLTNDYEQYRRWGSIANPFTTTLHFMASWAFWYGVFWLIGGHALACALFGGAFIWAIGIRTFNYGAHAKGERRHNPKVDFNTRDNSINQLWPGFVAGEWHNNHHLYPRSARAGFLRWQLDLPWLYIHALQRMGAVHKVTNHAPAFHRKYSPGSTP